MKYKWLNKNNNKSLILFFNGWGMDECVVKHLKPEGFDVVMFYDYNNLDTDFDFERNYSSIYLIAWSMGVMISSIFSAKYKANKTTIINGTLKPIDETYGIHPKIYDLTIKGFNEKGKDKFISNMFAEERIMPELNRDIENQKSELIALKNYEANFEFNPDKILISDNDKIIPTKNQSAFWKIKPNLKGGHCPFFDFEKWSELL